MDIQSVSKLGVCRFYKFLFSSQEDRNGMQPYHLPYTQAYNLLTLIYTHLHSFRLGIKQIFHAQPK